LRVKDGQPLLTCAYGAKEDPCNGQTEIATDDATDTLFYLPGKGQGTVKEVVAVKLALRGAELAEQELWRVPIRGTCPTMALHDGQLYTGNDVVEIATGKVTPFGTGKGSPTRWMLAVAGNRLYTLKNGVAQVFGLTGKLLATNKLLPANEPGDMAAQHIAQRGAPDWGFSYSCPFTVAGNRLLVRSQDCLYCLGEQPAK
jgi:hypothetical protein